MRPKEIIWFERLYLASLLLGLVQPWLAWTQLAAMTRATGGPSVFTMMLTLAFLVALALLISRRRSKAALWVSLGLFVLGLPFMLWSVSRGLFVGSLVIAGAQVVGKLVAYGLLFMPDAWDWLNRRPLHAHLRDTFS